MTALIRSLLLLLEEELKSGVPLVSGEAVGELAVVQRSPALL